MKSPRTIFLALGGAALLVTTLALLPGTASACGDKDKPCPCGAMCPEGHMEGGAAAGGCDEQKAGGCGEKKAGACGCGGAAAATAPGEAAPAAECPHAAGAAAGECPHAAAAAAGECPHAAAARAKAGAEQQAVIDPATGKLVVPDKNSPASDEGADAAPAARSGDARQVEIAQPGAGVMAPFPADRASKAVANVDESGKANSACAE